METFNITLTQKSFEAKATSVKANDLSDLSTSIATFCKETVNLHEKLKAHKVLNHNTRIKAGQEMNITIDLVEDDFSISTSLRNFGRFVKNSELHEIVETIHETLKYQNNVAYLFNVKE